MASKPNTTPYDLPDDAVWFITGCSSGIGKSLAEQVLAHPTHRLVATARKPASMSGLAGGDDRLLKLSLDVTSQAAVDAAVAAAVARFGRIDVLINNAGFGVMGEAEAMTRDQERAQLEANFWGPVALCKHAVSVMRDENPKAKTGGGRIGGVVLNVTSMGGFVGVPLHGLYSASKFALEGYTESMAKEMLPGWNIHFCIVEPGGVKTQFMANVNHGAQHPAYASPDAPGNKIRALMANPDMPDTFAKPEDVARAMLKVVVDAGSGGAHRRIPIRLALGADTYGVVKDTLEEVGRDLEEFKELSLSALKTPPEHVKLVA